MISILSIKETRMHFLQQLHIPKGLTVKNILLSIFVLVFWMITYKYLVLIDPFTPQTVKANISYDLTVDFSTVLLFAMISIGPIWEEAFLEAC